MYPDSTLRYLQENEHAFSLPRDHYTTTFNPRSVNKPSVRGILWDRLKQITSVSPRYVYAFFREYQEIVKLSAMKDSMKGKRALVLGNGPSLGYLTNKLLSGFLDSGNDVFAVNYWNLSHLGDSAPSYLVISDGITLADPDTFHELKLSATNIENNKKLETFLHRFDQIVIFCPLSRVKELAKSFGSGRVLGFVDHEMRAITSSIDPRFPRGYVSMTLFKALALAIHMGYDQICLLGMDNTYARDVFCDNENRIHRLERHSGTDDCLFDQSKLFPTMDVWAQDILNHFSDLHRCFKGYPIVNLDPYSLTDVFKKIQCLDVLNVVLDTSI